MDDKPPGSLPAPFEDHPRCARRTGGVDAPSGSAGEGGHPWTPGLRVGYSAANTLQTACVGLGEGRLCSSLARYG
jgi:hypothetical protein